MFNDRYGLTQAVLCGRKTMTRRMCKEYKTGELILEGGVEGGVEEWRYYPAENLVEFVMKDGSVKVCELPYRAGEVVAVAQAYKKFLLFNHAVIENGKQTTAGTTKGWTNKMFVRADLMPIKIQITDMYIERLQDISDADCMKEGVCKFDYGFYVPCLYRIPSRGVLYSFKTPRESFATLMDKPGVGQKNIWGFNPWVVVYEYRVKKEVLL